MGEESRSSRPELPLRSRPVEVRLPPSGVFVLESHHGPGFRMSAASHDYLEVFYVLRGTGRFLIEDEVHPCQDGDVVVVPVGRRHQVEDDPNAPLSLYGVCVHPDVWRHEPDLLEAVPAGCLALSGSMSIKVRTDLRQLLFEQTFPRRGSTSAVLGLTIQLLALLAGAAGPGRIRPDTADRRAAVERYATELKHHFFEASDLDRVAEGLDMSRRSFTQLFREVTGSTWADHVAGLRIEYSRQLLETTDRSITAIAFESGFEDVSNFYRVFKRRTGHAPNHWRKTHRAET